MWRFGNISVTAAKLSRVLFRNTVEGTMDQLLQVQLVDNAVFWWIDWSIDWFSREDGKLRFPQKAVAPLSAGGPCQKSGQLWFPINPLSVWGNGQGESSRTHRTSVIQGWWGSGELFANFKNLIVQGNLWRRSSHDIATASGACWFLLHVNTAYFGSYDGALQAPQQRKS